MTLRWDVLLAILVMTLASLLCRAGGYALLRAFRPPAFVDRMLQHLPGCIFLAYILPGVVAGGPPLWAGALATAAVQLACRSLSLATVAGVAAVAGVQALG